MEMNDKINILHVVNGFAIGGGELKLLELVEHLNKEKYNQVVCSVGQGGPLHEQFKEVSSKVVVFPKKNKFDIGLIFKVAKLMKEEKINIVQTTLFYADVIGALAAKLAKSPYVISWDVVTQQFKKRHEVGFRIAKRYIDLVVTVSDAINRKVSSDRGVPQNKVRTIRYGVDLSKFQNNSGINKAKRKELGFCDEDILLGTVARLSMQKGHKYLIEAAPQIIKQFPNVKFVFIGDGPLRKDIENQISSLGLDSYFYLMGFRNDVQEILGIFDVFILPSLWEGLPNVVLEAMASSRPVIATAVDGTPEAVIDNENGYLVPSKDPIALQNAIIRLISNKNQLIAFGQNSRRRVEEYFSLEKQVSCFEDLYDEVGEISKKN